MTIVLDVVKVTNILGIEIMTELKTELKAGDTVYITKYALTKGIQKAVISDPPREKSDLFKIQGDKWSYFTINKNAFLTFNEAVIQAQKMRMSRIKSYEKSITKLQKMSFDITE